MLNNLGIYNDSAGNSETINTHITQGLNFRSYSNNYVNAKENDHSLLGISFFPELYNGNIIEGYVTEGYINTPIDASFNRLFDEYKLLLTTYKSELQLAATAKTVTATQLSTKYSELLAASTTLMTAIGALNTEGTSNQASINTTIQSIQTKLVEIAAKNKTIKPTDLKNEQKLADTINGKMETATLKMTSIYYFYIVYFLVAVTIICMTFNLMVNPNADVMKSVYVVGGILAIYIIAKYIGK